MATRTQRATPERLTFPQHLAPPQPRPWGPAPELCGRCWALQGAGGGRVRLRTQWASVARGAGFLPAARPSASAVRNNSAPPLLRGLYGDNWSPACASRGTGRVSRRVRLYPACGRFPAATQSPLPGGWVPCQGGGRLRCALGNSRAEMRVLSGLWLLSPRRPRWHQDIWLPTRPRRSILGTLFLGR